MKLEWIVKCWKWIKSKLHYIFISLTAGVLFFSGILFLSKKKQLDELKERNGELQKQLLRDQISKNEVRIKEFDFQNDLDEKKFDQLEKERLWLHKRVGELKKSQTLTDEEALELFKKLRMKKRINDGV